MNVGVNKTFFTIFQTLKRKKKIFKMNWIFKNKTHSKSVKTSANHNLPFMNRKKVKMGMK